MIYFTGFWNKITGEVIGTGNIIKIAPINQKLFPCPNYGPGLRIEWNSINGINNYLIEYKEENGEWKYYTWENKNWTNFLEPPNSRNCTVDDKFCTRCIKLNQVYNFRVKARDDKNNDLTDWSETASGIYNYEEINETDKKIEEIPEQIYYNIKINTLDYLRNEQKPAAKPATGMEINSIPDEMHPVVLYTDINIIKERIKNEPYKTWWNEIKNTNEWVVNYDISKFTRIQKATYSKIMAFEYAITKDERYGNKSRDLLLNMNSGTYKENEEVEGLIWFSEAYDMLKGANYNFNAVEQVCRKVCKTTRGFTWKKGFYKKTTCTDVCEDFTKKEEKIKSLLKGNMESLATTSITEIASNDMVRNNNLHIRRFSAVGVAALVLHNKEFFDDAMNGDRTGGVVGKIADNIVNWFTDAGGFNYKGVKDVINYQIVDSNEGGWAEGPSYMRYSFLAAIPFIKAMENAKVENNWLDTTTLKNLFDWGVKIRMPNGARPPFDDSNLEISYFFGGYLNNPVYNWDWINSDNPYYSNDWGSVTLIDNICYYDDKTGITEPNWEPTQILPKAGEIIFRSGWKENDNYLAFLAENNRAVNRGFEHEHFDTMSFILYAYGKYLAIDSGYINYDNRAKTNKPVNHNVVLVDGMLASNGYINEVSSFSTEFLDYGEATDNSRQERGILFIDKDYYLIFDLINANTKAEFLMHGNGLISQGTARKYSSSAGEWIQDNVGLLAYVLTKPGDSVSFKTGTDSKEYGESSQHTYMSVIKTGKNIGFLSLLYPSENRKYPIIISNKTKDNIQFIKMEKDNWKGIALVNEQKKLLNLTEQGVDIETDASKLFVKLEDGKIKYIFADDVTKMNINKENFFVSTNPTTLAVKYDNANIEIYYNDNGVVKLYEKTSNVVYNSQERNDLYNNGVVSL